MDINAHGRTEAALGAGFAMLVAVAGLAMLATGFLSEGADALVAERQQLEVAFDYLGFARAFAYGDVMQAAGDALAKMR